MFTVDGRPKSFRHLTPAENVYARISSTIRARPAAGVREALTINFLSIDLALAAAFTTVSLPDVRKKQPNIVLADGTVQAHLGR